MPVDPSDVVLAALLRMHAGEIMSEWAKEGCKCEPGQLGSCRSCQARAYFEREAKKRKEGK